MRGLGVGRGTAIVRRRSARSYAESAAPRLSGRYDPCSVEGMTMLVAMCVLLVASAAVMPSWPYSAKWGIVPSAACGLAAFGAAALLAFGVL